MSHTLKDHDHTCLVTVPIFNHLELDELSKITELIKGLNHLTKVNLFLVMVKNQIP